MEGWNYFRVAFAIIIGLGIFVYVVPIARKEELILNELGREIFPGISVAMIAITVFFIMLLLWQSWRSR